MPNTKNDEKTLTDFMLENFQDSFLTKDELVSVINDSNLDAMTK